MITLQKHEITANVKDRYANILYCFHFENTHANGSNELSFEITIDPNAFISKFTANIDGELFIGETKERETASKEYTAAKEKKENAILINQPHKDIANLFEIKTNIDGKSKIILTIEIQQYLQKHLNFNELNIQILRSFNKYNIVETFEYIAFKINIQDISGIYDINIPMINNNDIIIEQEIIDKWNQKCEINGKIICKLENNVIEDVEWRKRLKVEDEIDVKDRGKWYMAKVIDKSEKKVNIHYYGYNTKYDEYIDINSERLAIHKSKTSNIKTNELTLKYKIKGEVNDSHILFDKNSNTFCHIISDVITNSMIMESNVCNNILIARRVMFVIDESGSMGGSKWLNTLSSTIIAIKQLRIGYDRFGIILFNNKTKILPSKDIRGCILANEENINESVNALQNENVGGGTNINDALLKAIELIKIDILLLNNDNNVKYNFFMNQIIFITDGAATHGVQDTNKIMINVRNANAVSKIDKYCEKISIFSFGVGRDSNDSGWTKGLNHSFLKLLSINNNGFYHRIKQSSVDTQLSQYFSILSKPILSNINIEYKNKTIKELTNNKFNTLYCGNDLIICGQIEAKQNMNDYNLLLSISAITGTEIKENNKRIIKPINISKQFTFNIDCETKENEEINTINNIKRIWAYLKLKQFATQKLIYNDMIEIEQDEKKENDSLPLSLALKYNFISPWTSMIVVKKKKHQMQNEEKEIKNDGNTVSSKQMMADGLDHNKQKKDAYVYHQHQHLHHHHHYPHLINGTAVDIVNQNNPISHSHGHLMSIIPQFSNTLSVASTDSQIMSRVFHPVNRLRSVFQDKKNKPNLPINPDPLDELDSMDVLNNYDKHKELGNGTDAFVYEVVDRRDKSHVAMKLTKRKSGRYKTEIHLLHQLRTCPYVVKLLNCLENDNVYVLILEHAPMSLENLLLQRCTKHPMQERVAKTILSQILKGIAAIHNLGFVHKDIKPENILIFANRSERKLIAKVADFGFATRVAPDNLGIEQLPREKYIEFEKHVRDRCGTPGFWPPELVTSLCALKYAFRMDVFSAGVTLYRMLCNEMPFGIFESWKYNIDHRDGQKKLCKVKPNWKVISWIQSDNKYTPVLSSRKLSDVVKDLLRSMLRIRPEQRANVDACLLHQFFQNKKIKSKDHHKMTPVSHNHNRNKSNSNTYTSTATYHNDGSRHNRKKRSNHSNSNISNRKHPRGSNKMKAKG